MDDLIKGLVGPSPTRGAWRAVCNHATTLHPNGPWRGPLRSTAQAAQADAADHNDKCEQTARVEREG